MPPHAPADPARPAEPARPAAPDPVVITRAITAADCEPARPLAIAHARFERSEVQIPRDWADRVAARIAQERLDVFIATSGGEAVGFASLTSDVSTWTGELYGHLDCLYVDEAERGAGVGQLLLSAVSDRATARGLTELQWQTPTWNERAIAFYRRTGARSTTKERFTLAQDERAGGSA